MMKVSFTLLDRVTKSFHRVSYKDVLDVYTREPDSGRWPDLVVRVKQPTGGSLTYANSIDNMSELNICEMGHPRMDALVEVKEPWREDNDALIRKLKRMEEWKDGLLRKNTKARGQIKTLEETLLHRDALEEELRNRLGHNRRQLADEINRQDAEIRSLRDLLGTYELDAKAKGSLWYSRYKRLFNSIKGIVDTEEGK